MIQLLVMIDIRYYIVHYLTRQQGISISTLLPLFRQVLLLCTEYLLDQ